MIPPIEPDFPECKLYESLGYERVTQFPTDAHFRKRLTQEAAGGKLGAQ